MPSLSSCLSLPRVYMGSQAPTLGVPGQACQAAPSTEGSRPWPQAPQPLAPALLLCHISLPVIPVGSSPLGSGDAANTGEAHNVPAQPAPCSRTRQLLH